MNTLNLYILLVLVFMLVGFAIGVLVHALSQGKVKFEALLTTLFSIMGGLLSGLGFHYLLARDQNFVTREGLAAAVIGGLVFALISRLLVRDREEIRTSTTRWR